MRRKKEEICECFRALMEGLEMRNIDDAMENASPKSFLEIGACIASAAKLGMAYRKTFGEEPSLNLYDGSLALSYGEADEAN